MHNRHHDSIILSIVALAPRMRDVTSTDSDYIRVTASRSTWSTQLDPSGFLDDLVAQSQRLSNQMLQVYQS